MVVSPLIIVPLLAASAALDDPCQSAVQAIHDRIQTQHTEGEFVATRAQWPAGVDIRIGVLDRRFHTSCRVLLHLADSEGEVQDTRRVGGMMATPRYILPLWTDSTVKLPALTAGANVVHLRYSITTTDPQAPITVDDDLHIPVQIVPSIDDVLSPLEDQQIAQSLAGGLSIEIHDGGIGSVMAHVHLAESVELPEHVSFAFVLEFVHNGTVLGVKEFWCDDQFRNPLRQHDFGPEHLRNVRLINAVLEIQGNAEAMLDAAAAGTLIARFRGDPIVALRDFERTVYFSGTFDVTNIIPPPQP